MRKKTFKIDGLHCASCAQSAQKILYNNSSISFCRVNYGTSRVYIESKEDVSTDLLNSALEKAGYFISEWQQSKNSRKKAGLKSTRFELFTAFLFAIPLYLIAMIFHHQIDLITRHLLMFFLTMPVVLYSSVRFFRGAWAQIQIKSVNMDSLVALGIIAPLFLSLYHSSLVLFQSVEIDLPVYYESVAWLIAFVLLGKYLEEQAKTDAQSTIDQLKDFVPSKVKVLHEQGEVEIPIEMVQEGEIYSLQSKDIVPLDSIVVEGQAWIDRSAITGESVPLSVRAGEMIYAGTKLISGTVKNKVEKTHENTLISSYIDMIIQAQESRLPMQTKVDLISRYFVPIVFLISAISFFAWFFLQGSFTVALMHAINVLVIACPCALGLAIPFAIVLTVNKASAMSVLIRNMESMQQLNKVTDIVLDKTGTLTEGNPQIINEIWIEEKSEAFLLSLAQLTQFSEHPLSKIIFQNTQILTTQQWEVEEIWGKGLASKRDGQTWVLGNSNWMRENGINIAEEIHPDSMVVHFGLNQKHICSFYFEDKLRSDAELLINFCKSTKIKVHVLSGDREAAVKKVVQKLKIESYQSEVLPEDKFNFIKKLQTEQKITLMIGDGVNDAAALQQSDLSISLQSGNKIAISSSQIILMKNQLKVIPQLFQLSNLSQRIIRSNLFWAFLYNGLGIPVAMGLFSHLGFTLNPMWAGAAMTFSSISVVLNSLRIKLYKV